MCRCNICRRSIDVSDSKTAGAGATTVGARVDASGTATAGRIFCSFDGAAVSMMTGVVCCCYGEEALHGVLQAAG